MSTEPDVMGYDSSGKRQPLPRRALRPVLGALRRVSTRSWRRYLRSIGWEPPAPGLTLQVWYGGQLAAECRVQDLWNVTTVLDIPRGRIPDPEGGHSFATPSVVVQVVDITERSSDKVHW